MLYEGQLAPIVTRQQARAPLWIAESPRLPGWPGHREAGPSPRSGQGDGAPASVPRASASGRPFAAVSGTLLLEPGDEGRLQADDPSGVTGVLADLVSRLVACERALSSLQAELAQVPSTSAPREARSDMARPAVGRPELASARGKVELSDCRQRSDGLTRRETEVLTLVADGRASKEIAEQLCVTVPTVSRHIANIYAKIDARNRADATRFALRMIGEVQPRGFAPSG